MVRSARETGVHFRTGTRQVLQHAGTHEGAQRRAAGEVRSTGASRRRRR
jgi:hypothetical protein